MVAAATTAALSAGPGAARAEPAHVQERTQGWVLPAAASVSGDRVNTSYGCHHGATRFGIYEMSGGIVIAGKQSAWTYEVNITADGALHSARKVRFASYSSSKARRQVLSVFKKTRYHYLAQNGHEYIQGVWHGGQQQELQAFAPAPGTC